MFLRRRLGVTYFNLSPLSLSNFHFIPSCANCTSATFATYQQYDFEIKTVVSVDF